LFDLIKPYYVYIYYDPLRNHEPFYVGKGINERAWCHLYRNDMHPFTQRIQWIRKNGSSPKIGFYAGLDAEESLSLEIWFIYNFGRKDLGLGPLLNLTDGGDGLNNPSEEIKNKISNSKKGSVPWNVGIPHSDNTKEKMKVARTKQIFSEETKIKMSKASLGKPKSPEHNKNVSIAKTGKKRRPFSEEWKQKMSESHKQRWKKIKEAKDDK
jgi:hypothetical protein